MRPNHASLAIGLCGCAALSLAFVMTVTSLARPASVQAAIASDPNAEIEAFRPLRSKAFVRAQRTQVRSLRKEDSALTPGFSYTASDLPSYSYPGDTQTVREGGEVSIPSRCAKMKGARGLRCAAVYLKYGISYQAYETRIGGTFAESKAAGERLTGAVKTRGPGRKPANPATDNEGYVPVLEEEPLMPPSDLLFESLTVSPRHFAAPTVGPVRPTKTLMESATEE